MKLRDTGIGIKIITGSVFPMLIVVFLGVTGVMTLRFLTGIVESVDGVVDMKQRATDVQRSVLEMENEMLVYLWDGGEEQLRRYERARARVSAGLAVLKKEFRDKPEELKKLEDGQLAVESWQTNSAKPAIESRSSTTESTTVPDLYAAVFGGEAGKQLDKAHMVLRSFRRSLDTLAKDHVVQAEHYAWLMENLVIFGVGLTLALTVAINYLIARRLTNRLGLALSLAEDISKGDLSRRLNAKSKDEIGRLGASLDAMADTLRNQTRHMQDAVNILSTSAAEISTTVSQVAQSTSSTSTSVAETTTTIEEVKQAARIASEKSKDVARMAEESVRVSSEGKTATEETIARMNLIKEQMESVGETVVRLSEHGQTIAEIIKTVQDLADQSNLLAVNASIEAARAGDHGKGFSIVAHEIKTLADQSKEATDQVRTILGETRKWVSAVVMATEQGTKAVGKGVQQSTKAGEAIAILSNSVAESAQAARVIQTSSEQQFSGVDQVSGAMVGIEEAVRQNLVGTKHLEDAAQRLADLGQDLKQLMEEYKT